MYRLKSHNGNPSGLRAILQRDDENDLWYECIFRPAQTHLCRDKLKPFRTKVVASVGLSTWSDEMILVGGPRGHGQNSW